MASNVEQVEPNADTLMRLASLQLDRVANTETAVDVPTPTIQPAAVIKEYLLKNVPEFKELADLRQKGWDNPEGDQFFKRQRQTADNADQKTARRFYIMMITIGHELHKATGGLTIPPALFDAPRVLDMCMAPGGFLHTVLSLNPEAHALAYSLPVSQGGHKVLLRKGRNVSINFLDITLLAGDIGVTEIPAGHPDEKNFNTKRTFGDQNFGLVLCDGQVLRTHSRAAYRENVEARRLTLTQLTIGLSNLEPGGTMIVLLHKVDSWESVYLLYTFSKFSSLQLFKSRGAHAKRSSFYMIARGVQSGHEEALAAIRQWKKGWKAATFGDEEDQMRGAMRMNGDGVEVDARVVLEEFGLELVEMGREIWKIQAQGLARASFIRNN